MSLLLGALTIGLVLSLLAFGVLISFRLQHVADITVDGSITLGAATAAVLLTRGVNPLAATVAAIAAGAAAGTLSGVLHTRFKIDSLLAGILVMTALYSVNLRVMGRSNLPLMDAKTLTSEAERVAARLLGGAARVDLWGWSVSVREVAELGLAFFVAMLAGAALYAFFRTDLGTAMRAAGDNPQMARALGIDTDRMTVLGLALSNGLVALSGALLSQVQGFADVQMGIGMVVWGLASVIMGGALVGSSSLGLTVAGAVMGSVLFRLLVAIALRWGLNPNDLKLVTALFVLAALVLPALLGRARRASRLAGTEGRPPDERRRRGAAAQGLPGA